MAPKMFDEKVVAFPACGEKVAMPDVHLIVNQRCAVEIRHFAARFVHDKIGCGKIPVAAISSRKCRIQRSISYKT